MRLSLFAVLVHPRRRRRRRALRRESRLRRAATLVREAQRFSLGRGSRSLHDGARATALALLPVPQPPLVVGKLESLRLDGVHPPLLRVRRVAVIQQRGEFLDDGRGSGRDGVEVELRVEDGVGHAAGEVDGRRRGHRGGVGGDAILLPIPVGILLLLVVVLLLLLVGFLLLLIGSLAAATTARGGRGGGPFASLGGGLAAPLLPALLGSVLLVLLVLNRLLDDRLLQSRDVPDEFHHRPLLDHAHPRRGRRGLGEDALRPNRRHRRRRDGVVGVVGLRLVAVGIHRDRAVRGLTLVRVRLDSRLRRLGFLSLGRRGGGLRGCGGGGGGATRSARLGLFRLGLLPLLGSLSLGILLVVILRFGHQLRGGRDGLLHRALPRLLPEVSNLRGDSRALPPPRLLGGDGRPLSGNPLRRDTLARGAHLRALPRSLQPPVPLRREVRRHPSHLDHDVIPVRFPLVYAVGTRGDLRAEHRARLANLASVGDHLVVLGVSSLALLVRLVVVFAERGEVWQRDRVELDRLLAVERHVCLHVDDPRFVVVVRRGCRRRGSLGSLGGGSLGGGAFVSLGTRHGAPCLLTCRIGRAGRRFSQGVKKIGPGGHTRGRFEKV